METSQHPSSDDGNFFAGVVYALPYGIAAWKVIFDLIRWAWR